MWTLRTFALLTVSLWLVGPVSSAQVSARQGTSDVTEFESPMVLEVPFPDVSRLPPGSSLAVTSEIRRYRCVGVSLTAVDVRVKDRSRRGDGDVTLEISGALQVPPSVDRLIDVRVVVKKAETVLGTAKVERIDAEEDRTTKFRCSLRIDQARLAEAFSSEPHPSLELTVAVSDNG